MSTTSETHGISISVVLLLERELDTMATVFALRRNSSRKKSEELCEFGAVVLPS